ncbi:MAG: PEP-CTERM sorting domain-containing protein [Salinisphaera sp.]|uniref:PEP-CTERM sorting domain-containing protein n=1 Tax=Salinisphaera sp. TaxID=1914330 RepID=UPI003C7E05EB
MKTLYGTAVGAMAALMVAGPAFASQVDVQAPAVHERALYYVENAAGFLNVDSFSTQANAGYWTIGATNSSSSLLEATRTANYKSATFGVYDPGDPTNRLNLLGAGARSGANNDGITGCLKCRTANGTFVPYYTDANSVQNDLETADFGGDIFGYFLTIGGHAYYSDAMLNGGTDRLVSYEGTSGGKGLMNEYLFGWADGADNDYQDYVATVESTRPVPEPSSIAMFGVGLIMIGFAIRRMQRRDA